MVKKAYRKAKYRYIQPSKFDHIKTRVICKKKWYGSDYGGFYLNPDLINKDSIVYSVGIGEDISFDKSVIKAHGCNVWGFDPTPKSIAWCKNQELPKGFHFHEYGLAKESGTAQFHLPKQKENVSGSLVDREDAEQGDLIDVEMKSLSDILSMLNHKKIDVLKMDIEGTEYEVIDQIFNSSIKIDQLAVEFHEGFFKGGKEKTIKAIDQLSEMGLELFGISSGFAEISFIRKNLL